MGSSSFRGRVCVIVGGSSGIGAGIAGALAGRAATVVVVGRSRERFDRAQRQSPLAGCRYLSADVSSRPSCEQLASALREEHGVVDHLIYSAGFFATAPLGQIETETWQRSVDTNLSGAMWIVQSLLPLMRLGAGKSIVLVSSILAHVGSVETCAYSAAKGGLSALGRSLALELAKDGIRLNLVSPAHIDTPMLAGVLDRPGAREELARRYPLGRIGLPADVAGIVLFLLGDEAGWITGQDIIVDGGRSLGASS